MKEIFSEPAWQHFLKQNSFQPVPKLAIFDEDQVAKKFKTHRQSSAWWQPTKLKHHWMLVEKQLSSLH